MATKKTSDQPGDLSNIKSGVKSLEQAFESVGLEDADNREALKAGMLNASDILNSKNDHISELSDKVHLLAQTIVRDKTLANHPLAKQLENPIVVINKDQQIKNQRPKR